MSRVTIEARRVTLCRKHAARVAVGMPKTWEEFRALFALPSERRSPVARRQESEDRRVLPPRPEGRRRAYGRRGSDPVE